MKTIRRTLFGRRGFTLVEAIMSMLIVSVLLVSALNATGASALAQYKTAERSTARFLADGLMSSLLATAYEDPAVAASFGLESGEATSSKANYDDVDDFDGWNESPPQDQDGVVISNMTGWRRKVAVTRVNAATPTVTASAESGAKLVTITILHNSVPILTRVAVRTNAP